MAECETLVIKAQELHGRRVEVMNRNGVLDDVIGEVIRVAVDDTWLGSAASHPHREASRMVISAVVVLGQTALRIDCSAKFSTPDDESVLQHAALF